MNGGRHTERNMYDSRVNPPDDYWRPCLSIIYITITTSNPCRFGSFVHDTMGTGGTLISSLTTCEVLRWLRNTRPRCKINWGKPTTNLVVIIVDLRWWLEKENNHKNMIKIIVRRWLFSYLLWNICKCTYR